MADEPPPPATLEEIFLEYANFGIHESQRPRYVMDETETFWTLRAGAPLPEGARVVLEFMAKGSLEAETPIDAPEWRFPAISELRSCLKQF